MKMYENLEVLKKKSIPVYNLVRNLKVDGYREFGFEATNKDVDIYINNQEKVYLTSKNHKALEADILVDEILSGDYDEIVVFGIGNAVILEQLLKKVDKEGILHIIEYEEVIDILLRETSLKKVPFEKLNNLVAVKKGFDLKMFYSTKLRKSNMNVKLFILPQYRRNLEKEVQRLEDQTRQFLLSESTSYKVNQGYQKLWVYNSIINFKHVISTSRFIDLNGHDFSNSMAIIVGAGPSLNYDIEKIKELSEKGKCYIFAIGSAYRALLKNNIKVDALFSYDPTPLNQKVLSSYHESDEKAPICFGSTIGFESIREVEYDKAFHLLISQDYFGKYLLEGKNVEIVLDAPSVVVIALQALVKVGFKNVVFAGQNLAYLDEQNYADGVALPENETKRYQSNLLVKDVYGKDVSTSPGFKQMLTNLEGYISVLKGIKFINTTKGGAAIKGTVFKPLETIEFDDYDSKVNLLEVANDNGYNLTEAKMRFDELRNKREEFVQLLNEGFKLVGDVKKSIDTDSVKDVQKLVVLEKNYNAMTTNLYFNILMSKMDRNYLKMFESSVVEVNRERDLKKKYEMLYTKMGTLYSLFKSDDANVNNLFDYISKYIVWE